MSITTNITLGLLVAVLLILIVLALLALRYPVIAKLGVRNIPRRPSQSVLIMIGLTLSTIIIVSALSTGDTLNYSVRRQAVEAYGQIDEILAPPLLSTFAAMGMDEGAIGDENASQQELEQLMEGGLTTVLTVVDGGLPGISSQRYEQLRAEAQEEPLIDAVAGAIIFPTIIRNVTTGQGEPLGFIFAVDQDYDQEFGLTTIDGEAVEMEALEPGIGNIFAQASNLFGMVGGLAQNIGLEDFRISDVALATAAIGAALTAGPEAGVDLADLEIDIATLQSLGIDTTPLEDLGLETLSLDALGLDPDRLDALGVSTTTLSLDSVGVDTSGVQGMTDDLLAAINLNTLGSELDRVLAQVGLQLRQGDVYLNRLGAERMDASVGDVLEVFIGPIPIPFRVRGIVDQSGPMGALAPVVMLRLDEAQQLLFMQDKVNVVLVSNQGDELEGIEHTEAVGETLRVLALEPQALDTIVEILRRPEVRAAIDDGSANASDEVAADMEGAPQFVINLVEQFSGFDDLVADLEQLPIELDQPDISRPLRVMLGNGTIRLWLLDLDLPDEVRAELSTALSELNQFDLLDPLSKSSVLTIAEVGGTVFSSLFSIFGIFSIVAAVLLIFLIFVMMAAERRSELGMARAIGVQRHHLMQMFVTEGVLYDLAAAALGVLLGIIISYGMVGFMGNLFNNISGQVSGQSSAFSFRFRVAPTSVIIAYCLGVLFTFLVVTFAAWRVSRLNIVSAIRDLPEPESARSRSLFTRIWRAVSGPLLVIAGLVIYFQKGEDALSIILAAATLIAVGIGFVIGWILDRTSLRHERVQQIMYTLMGVSLLLIWGLPWPSWLGDGPSTVIAEGPWLLLGFVLTGPMIILGAILVVMFNADTLTWGISLLLGGIGALTPVLKTAIAYPLSARFRTGMTMLLFAMIISTVTIMGVVIEATQSIIAPNNERTAGFDISTSSSLLSFFDPIEDLEQEIATNSDFPAADVTAVGAVGSLIAEARDVDADGQSRVAVMVYGLNDGYLRQAPQVYSFSARADGYPDDESIWLALATRDDVAVVTPDLLQVDEEQGFFGRRGERHGRITVDEETDPDEFDDFFRSDFRLDELVDGEQIRDGAEISLRTFDSEQSEATVQVIGVLEQGITLAGDGIHTGRRFVEQMTGEPIQPEGYYIKVREGANVHDVAAALERSFLSNAINATVMAEAFAQGQAVTRGILRLFQGFMALGLLVGIAALGVISTRTVVERRQQVGMLRAIGFQPRMVALSFLLESSFIALTGIVIGTGAGVVLGRSIVNQFYAALTDGRTFSTPWLQIGLIVLLAYAFSLLTTILPALHAARIYPAEALRYE